MADVAFHCAVTSASLKQDLSFRASGCVAIYSVCLFVCLFVCLLILFLINSSHFLVIFGSIFRSHGLISNRYFHWLPIFFSHIRALAPTNESEVFVL